MDVPAMEVSFPFLLLFPDSFHSLSQRKTQLSLALKYIVPNSDIQNIGVWEASTHLLILSKTCIFNEFFVCI